MAPSTRLWHSIRDDLHGSPDEGRDGPILPIGFLLHRRFPSAGYQRVCGYKPQLGNGDGVFHFGKRSLWLPYRGLENAEMIL